ncbi:MAG TPA: addiction module toxin RelE [Candidatus Methylomirabilis sp.]|nr:addiction module toxin RelE [Candidatus Methylomirabilis sp.]
MLVYAPEAFDHLDAIERKYHRLIEKTIARQLRYTPEEVTRNRKPLEQPGPFGATWELRFGPRNRFRVLYEVNPRVQTVEILAIGVKEGNRLLIGREEYGE